MVCLFAFIYSPAGQCRPRVAIWSVFSKLRLVITASIFIYKPLRDSAIFRRSRLSVDVGHQRQVVAS